MSDTENDLKTRMKEKLTRWGIFAGIVIVAFLIGLVPMWMQKNQVARELASTQKQLSKSEIRGLLTTALVEANRGEYEAGRKNASEFFSSLRTEYDKNDEGSFPAEEREKLKTIFDNRDSTVTMLAQRDQASIQRLTDIYFTFQKAVGMPSSPGLPGKTAPQPTQ